jgi:hypothetical protein
MWRIKKCRHLPIRNTTLRSALDPQNQNPALFQHLYRPLAFSCPCAHAKIPGIHPYDTKKTKPFPTVTPTKNLSSASRYKQTIILDSNLCASGPNRSGFLCRRVSKRQRMWVGNDSPYCQRIPIPFHPFQKNTSHLSLFFFIAWTGGKGPPLAARAIHEDPIKHRRDAIEWGAVGGDYEMLNPDGAAT